ncbi:hypothetical protein PV325_012480 [Microctonus aethiopoides]|uniref:triacylglycerol lipase n=1 Tax=Microctonus aethiopoides TaxID=144406 RepID=A0AA39F1C5_9HYME|nr:hypothetical protein PV325_012480 [Microctonus aethiopoides]KAK0097818.1 hypothetical protein PV326_013506 [Microctonus aethiopoides]KAK0159388.1 hypothetical protein PV328_010268 [Microctonus aethiopoides]
MNLSFAGCGFLGIYHVGVAVCLKKYAPQLLLDKISGASAGAIAACCLLCDLPIANITSHLLKIVKEARRTTLGPFSPSFNVQAFLLESLQKYLPHDAHTRVNGKLHISLTRVYDGKNVIVSQFNSREDLLQALLASSFVPIFSGLLPPRFHGIRYMDGGFSDNLPTLDDNTITISPFCGESDICPRDTSSQLFHVNFANTSIELSRQNIYRFARILFPPNPEILSNMCTQGFDDALRFLHRNNLINCTRCVAVQSPFVISETLDDSPEYDPECVECKVHRQEALVANLPETVMSLFQDAIDSANKGIINWLFKHRSVKLLSLLSLPYTLPADVVYATFTKFIVNAPKLQSNILEIMRYFLEQLNILFPKVNVYYQPIAKTMMCQFAITEYGQNNFDLNVRDNNDTSYAKQWNTRKSSCVINITDLSRVEDTFENILQVSSDHEALTTYYYMDENKKIQMAEIFDVTQSSEFQDNNDNKNNQSLQCDDVSWDEPGWLAQHSVENVTNSEMDFNDYNLVTNDNQNFEEDEDELGSLVSTDVSIEGSNIFSDPESEWGMDKPREIILRLTSPASPDSRPEVDQPTQCRM